MFWLTENDIKQNLLSLPNVCFEVTEKCNLACTYCVYRELYNDHDIRNNTDMPISMAQAVLDYLASIWNSKDISRYNNETTISFYGGEPLLNISFIKEIVKYTSLMHTCRIFHFAITTNALLLPKYIDFFVKNQFRILISLDGDYDGSAHRINNDGKNSFPIVFDNIKYVQKQYPKYFKENVSFNSVLSNVNDVGQINAFIYKEFGKHPYISPINPRGVDVKEYDRFKAIYKHFSNLSHEILHPEDITETSVYDNPNIKDVFRYIVRMSGNHFESYQDLLNCNSCYDSSLVCPGTCSPFSRKLFVTAKGRILQCERIGHHFSIGNIHSNVVHLDFNAIVEQYNGLIRKMLPVCSQCTSRPLCFKCIYQIKDITTDSPICNKVSYTKESLFKEIRRIKSFLIDHPTIYTQLIETIHIK